MIGKRCQSKSLLRLQSRTQRKKNRATQSPRCKCARRRKHYKKSSALKYQASSWCTIKTHNICGCLKVETGSSSGWLRIQKASKKRSSSVSLRQVRVSPKSNLSYPILCSTKKWCKRATLEKTSGCCGTLHRLWSKTLLIRPSSCTCTISVAPRSTSMTSR